MVGDATTGSGVARTVGGDSRKKIAGGRTTGRLAGWIGVALGSSGEVAFKKTAGGRITARDACWIEAGGVRE